MKAEHPSPASPPQNQTAPQTHTPPRPILDLDVEDRLVGQLLDSGLPLTQIAAEAGISMQDLAEWVASPRIAAALESLHALMLRRAQLKHAQAYAIAYDALTRVLSGSLAAPESAALCRAATALLRNPPAPAPPPAVQAAPPPPPSIAATPDDARQPHAATPPQAGRSVAAPPAAPNAAAVPGAPASPDLHPPLRPPARRPGPSSARQPHRRPTPIELTAAGPPEPVSRTP